MIKAGMSLKDILKHRKIYKKKFLNKANKNIMLLSKYDAFILEQSGLPFIV